jgi:hypothetical protein
MREAAASGDAPRVAIDMQPAEAPPEVAVTFDSISCWVPNLALGQAGPKLLSWPGMKKLAGLQSSQAQTKSQMRQVGWPATEAPAARSWC